MFPNDSDCLLLEGNHTLVTQVLWERLNPSAWPFTLNDLPDGCALVGGAVRDGLLNQLKNKPDLDFVVNSNAIKLAQELSIRLGGNCVILDQGRDIARLVCEGWTIDFAKQIGETLRDDLYRRDFSINAIALTFDDAPKLFDPIGGIKDLREKRLVAIRESNLIDDPLRMLRAYRLMSELNLSLDIETKKYINFNGNLLSRVAPERIKYEIQRLIKGVSANNVLPLLKETTLLKTWQNHSVQKSLAIKANKFFRKEELEIALPLYLLVDLLSDKGLLNLCFSKKRIKTCGILRKWQRKNDGMSFKSLNESDRYQLHIELEEDLPALILDLSEADQGLWLSRWRDQNDPLFHPSSPLDGLVLQEILDVPEGPFIGELINHLCKEKAFNRLHTREEAVQLARNLWKQKQPFL